ncbi:hypothetical protein KM176_05670 [Pseudooceanicola sp. CBS1P-1]|uniref:Uncharacterized protein n=1 Tax=Pseudooceanicola albus TaxID=2692189 RepID=A0A6L7FYE4_9RHOB|nr:MULTISPECIES: hypothetical protein [Pseudooceanicola]MBT9383341.1 hypothetical protein [Pseudooceanicola endophyticus]MXN16336.1 hypothetical protein [Pseudooceanicola albus]
MFDVLQNTRAAIRANAGMFAVLVAVVAVSGSAEAWEQLSRYRVFRDITLQTPFRAVTVEQESVPEGLAVRGSMIKTRCVYGGLTAYALMPDGLRRPVRLDLSPETDIWGGGSRAPSGQAEAWGPWILSTPLQGTPQAWEIWAFHLCPEGRQANRFASGPWTAKP